MDKIVNSKVNIKIKDGNDGICKCEYIKDIDKTIPIDKLARVEIGNAYTFSLDTGNCQNCDKKLGNFDRTRITKVEINITLPCDVKDVNNTLIKASCICRNILKINTIYTLEKYKKNIKDDDNLSLLKSMLKKSIDDIDGENVDFNIKK